MNQFQFLTPQPPNLRSLVIEGRRLRLVTISKQFVQNIFDEFTCEITHYMVPSPAQDIEETRSFIAESRCSMQAGHNLQLVIVEKTRGEFLGCCGLHGEGKVRTPELGIWLKKSAHGKGYGQEAIQTLVSWAWKSIDLDYFMYPVDRNNTASVKIPQSLGGEVMEDLKIKTPSGKILDILVYKIVRANSFTD
jgi:[ribosomal protein S5]-alanine N-acetyltransferase